MVNNLFPSVVLTYKGKILLQSPDLPVNGPLQLSWCLIGGEKIGSESFEQAILRKIKHTTKLELKKINNLGRDFYHGELTDNDVNCMERREGQRLEFYTLHDLEKLTLTQTTEGLLTEYRNKVEEILSH